METVPLTNIVSCSCTFWTLPTITGTGSLFACLLVSPEHAVSEIAIIDRQAMIEIALSHFLIFYPLLTNSVVFLGDVLNPGRGDLNVFLLPSG